jgi:hypothetical protein
MALKITHHDRCDTITIEGARFRVWWANCRPAEFRVETDGNLTVDQMRAFIAWCDAQPPVKREV